MTEKQIKIIGVLKQENKKMTMAEISEVAGERLVAASATPLVRKGVLGKVEGTSPVVYFLTQTDEKKMVFDFLSRETIKYSSAENIMRNLGVGKDILTEMVQENILDVHGEFGIYTIKNN